MTFNDKTAVITGGSSGIGLGIALALAEQGANICLFARNKMRLEQAATLFNKKPLIISGDTSVIDDLDQLYQATINQYGSIDMIVANAAIETRVSVNDADEATFDTLNAINFKGVYFTIQRACQYLKPGASLLLVSSVQAHFAMPEYSIYAATKAAVSQLARNFAADLITSGIRVNAISPGPTRTPLLDPIPQAFIEVFEKKIPMQRLAEIDEITKAAVFLLSDQASYINGQDLLCDGGLKNLRS